MNSPIKTPQDLKIGDRVRSKIEQGVGTVSDLNYSGIIIHWDDGGYSQYRKDAGFVLYKPEPEAE